MLGTIASHLKTRSIKGKNKCSDLLISHSEKNKILCKQAKWR